MPTFQEEHVHRKLVIADLFSPPSESESQEKSTDTEMEEEMEAVSRNCLLLKVHSSPAHSRVYVINATCVC